MCNTCNFAFNSTPWGCSCGCHGCSCSFQRICRGCNGNIYVIRDNGCSNYCQSYGVSNTSVNGCTNATANGNGGCCANHGCFGQCRRCGYTLGQTLTETGSDYLVQSTWNGRNGSGRCGCGCNG